MTLPPKFNGDFSVRNACGYTFEVKVDDRGWESLLSGRSVIGPLFTGASIQVKDPGEPTGTAVNDFLGFTTNGDVVVEDDSCP